MKNRRGGRLHIDIETAYIIGAVWGMFEQNVVSVLQDEYILGVGYSWDDEKTVYWKGLPDFPKTYKKDHKDDSALMAHIRDLLCDADEIVAHNGKSFDMKKLRMRMLLAGLPPFPEPKIIDTKLVFRRHFGFASNKLDELSRQLLGDRKVKHPGIEMWTGCMNKIFDPEMWFKMGFYCKKDVVLLKKIHHKSDPWEVNVANRKRYTKEDGCIRCGGHDMMKRGEKPYKEGVYKMYQCKDESCRKHQPGELLRTWK